MILPSRFLQASFLLSGAILGVGIFALPFVFSRAGFLLGTAELLLLTFVTVVMNLFYGEVILRTPSRHLLPGLVRFYLAKPWFYLETISALVGFFGTLFLYVLIGGIFLGSLLGSGSGFGQILFFGLGALFILFNLKLETKVNYFLTLLLVVFIVILAAISLQHFSPAHISGVNLREIFLPYGVILFALSGAGVIPEVVSFLGDQRKLLAKSLVIGTLIPAAVYFVFILGVVGATGFATTPEALQGLRELIGRPLFLLGNAIGFLATFTSFILFGFTLEDMFRVDFRFSKFPAWLLTVGAPALLFLLPLRNFIYVMNFLGAIAIGIDSLFVLWLYKEARRAGTRSPEYELGIPSWAVVPLGLLFLIGLAAPFV